MSCLRRAFLLILGLVSLGSVMPSPALARPVDEADFHLIEDLVLAQVWKPGGADAEALSEVLAGFLRTRNYEGAICLVGRAAPFIDRGRIAPAPLAAVAGEAAKPEEPGVSLDWARTTKYLSQSSALWSKPQPERLELYRKVMIEMRIDGPLGLTYVDGCLRALWEDPQLLLSEAERACFNPKGIWARADARDFGKAALRVARARVDADPLNALLGIVVSAVDADRRHLESIDGTAPEELLDEALLALLADKQTKAISRLKAIWRGQSSDFAEGSVDAKEQMDLSPMPATDRKPAPNSAIGRSLIRAIRALGETSFPVKGLKSDPPLLPDFEDTCRALEQRGLLKFPRQLGR